MLLKKRRILSFHVFIFIFLIFSPTISIGYSKSYEKTSFIKKMVSLFIITQLWSEQTLSSVDSKENNWPVAKTTDETQNILNDLPLSKISKDTISSFKEIDEVGRSLQVNDDPKYFHIPIAVGRIPESEGFFHVGQLKINYVSSGGLTKRVIDSTANNGDIEVLSLGASIGRSQDEKDEYFDEKRMRRQGFIPINVKGERDKKVEIWYRRNTGQTRIRLPKNSRIYALLILQTRELNIDIESVNSNTVRSSRGPYQVPQVDDSLFNVLSYFSDDPVQLTSLAGGYFAFQDYQWGQGDGFALCLYPPEVSQPSSIEIESLGPGGQQYVGINTAFKFKDLSNPDPDPDPDEVRQFTMNANDCAEEKDGRLMTRSSDLELTYDRGEQLVGVHFTNLSIPRNSEILNAYIQFESDEESYGSLELEIYGEMSENSQDFSNDRFISTRTLTQNRVVWSPPDWSSVGLRGEAQRTADLSPIIQELVDTDWWESGQSLTFIIKRLPSDASRNKRVAETGRNPSLFVRLSNDFTDPDPDPDPNPDDVRQFTINANDCAEEKDGQLNTASTDLELTYDRGEQLVGVHFTGVRIPAASQILDAYIQFESDEESYGSLELEIYGEISENSQDFSNDRFISTRTLTQNRVVWSPPDWSSVGLRGEAQRTADLSPIIQELVDTDWWESGQSLTFIIKRLPSDASRNKRVAETGRNPSLYVRFSNDFIGPDPEDDLVMLAFGDSGTGKKDQMDVAKSMENVCASQKCEFAIMAGDNFYENGVTGLDDRQFFDKFEVPYGPLAIPFYAVLGNHDVRGSVSAQIRYTERSEWWNMPSTYYSTDIKNIRLIGLDTNDFDRGQINFLKSELNSSTAKWNIVFGHHPIFSSGLHGDTSQLVNQLRPILCEHKNTIYISGHDHHLELLDSGCDVPLIVSGSAGKLRDVWSNSRSIWAMSEYGYAILKFKDDQITINFYGKDEERLYDFNINSYDQ